MRRFVLFLATLLCCEIVSAATAIATENGLAINGHDPVAYITQNKALKGDSKYSYEWSGAKWVFGSLENRDLFASAPEKYAPQYGGHCAYAVGQRGRTSAKPPNGRYFANRKGKIYLFPDGPSYSAWFGQGADNMARWGDEAWPKIKEMLEAGSP